MLNKDMSLSCPLNTTKYLANLSIYVRIIGMGIVELGLCGTNPNLSIKSLNSYFIDKSIEK